MTRPARWRCHTCGETFTAWARAEAHGDQPGHHRIEVIIPTPTRRNPMKAADPDQSVRSWSK